MEKFEISIIETIESKLPWIVHLNEMYYPPSAQMRTAFMVGVILGVIRYEPTLIPQALRIARLLLKQKTVEWIDQGVLQPKENNLPELR